MQGAAWATVLEAGPTAPGCTVGQGWHSCQSELPNSPHSGSSLCLAVTIIVSAATVGPGPAAQATQLCTAPGLCYGCSWPGSMGQPQWIVTELGYPALPGNAVPQLCCTRAAHVHMCWTGTAGIGACLCAPPHSWVKPITTCWDYPVLLGCMQPRGEPGTVQGGMRLGQSRNPHPTVPLMSASSMGRGWTWPLSMELVHVART